MSTHDEIKADLSLFVLGALDEEEARTVAAHLVGCEECRAEEASWRGVVELLPLGVEAEAPPDLRHELRARLGLPPAAEATAAPAPPKVIAMPRRRWPAVALAAAASLAVAYGIARDAGQRRELEDQRQLVGRLRDSLTRAEVDRGAGAAELERVRAALAERERDAEAMRTALAAAEQSLALLRRPGLNLVRLKEAPEAEPAEGHVLISPSGQALFYAFDLAPLPADKVYELWWITEKEGPVQAGLFRPDAGGIGSVESALPTGAGALQAAAVTVEPAGGVPKPTGPMVLLGKI